MTRRYDGVMPTRFESAVGGPPRLVGQVHVEITIKNGVDVVLAAEGLRPDGDLRSITLDRVLVDTGATHLCLPARMIDDLGLPARREIVLVTAGGEYAARLVGPAELEIAGRATTVDIIGLPVGEQPLLGVVPMETLGLEPDLRQERLRLLPETGPQSHFTAC